MITKIRRVERITRYNNSTWEEATLCLLNPGKLARFSNFADVSSFFFFLFFSSSSSLVGGAGGVSGSSDRGRARCLLASSSNGLMGFETAQRHRDNPKFSFPTLFSQPHRDSPKADSGTLLSKLVSLLAIDCEKGEVSTCVSSAEGLPADRV